MGMGPIVLAFLLGMGPIWPSASDDPITLDLQWEKTSVPIDGLFWGVAVEPGNSSKLYAAIENLGIAFSEDGGITWETRDFWPVGTKVLGRGTVPRLGHHHVRAVALDPLDESLLYYLYGEGLVVIDRQTGSPIRSTGLGSEFGWDLENSASAIAIAPSGTLYVTSPGGIFKSTDKGITLEKIGEGLPSETIFSALAIDPSNPNTIYVGTREKWKFDDPPSSGSLEGRGADGYLGHGIYKSEDGGRTWHDSSAGLTDLNINTILIDPTDHSKLHAATYGGVFLSTDAGKSWIPINNGLSNSEVWTLVSDPTDLRRMYAGTWGGGVFSTQDGGDTWTPTGSDELDHDASNIFSLVFDPNDTSMLYIGTGDGLFKYDTQERLLSHVDGRRSLRAVYTAVNLSSSIVYTLEDCGFDIYRSFDEGSSWGFTGPFVRGPTNWAWPPLGAGDGNFVSDGEVLGHTYGMQIAFNPLDDSIVYYASDNGVFVSHNRGDSWSLLSGMPVSDQDHFHGIAIHPKNPDIIYVSSHTHDPKMETHMLKSEDAGDTWSLIDNGLPRSNYHQETVLVDPEDPDIVYMATTATGIGCETDHPCVSAGIYKTLDGGDLWFPVNDGLDSSQVPTMAFDPTNSDVLYAAAGDSLHVSRDAGGRWEKIFSVEGGGVSSIAIDPRDPSLVFVGTFGEDVLRGGDGVYASSDGGSSWVPVNAGLADPVGTPHVWHLAIDPRGGTLYASAERGVFKATYGGISPVLSESPVPWESPVLSESPVPSESPAPADLLDPDVDAIDASAGMESDVTGRLVLGALGASAVAVVALALLVRRRRGRARHGPET